MLNIYKTKSIIYFKIAITNTSNFVNEEHFSGYS